MVMGMLVAAAMTFTGCMKLGDSLGDVKFDYTDKTNSTTKAEATGSVNFTNQDRNNYARGMALFATEKKGITAKIEMDLSNSTNPGAMGIVFDLEKKNGLYNFCLISVKNNGGHPKCNISYYVGVSEANFGKSNFGVPESSRTDILDWDTAADSTISTISKNAEGKLCLVIEVEPVKAEGEGADTDTAYNVRFYADEDNDGTVSTFVKLSNKSQSEKNTIHGKAKLYKTITRAQVKSTSTKVIENKMGLYANVYGGQTLTGTWYIADMKNNPNVAKTVVADENSIIKLNF